jgi:hypothetical protein
MTILDLWWLAALFPLAHSCRSVYWLFVKKGQYMDEYFHASAKYASDTAQQFGVCMMAALLLNYFFFQPHSPQSKAMMFVVMGLTSAAIVFIAETFVLALVRQGIFAFRLWRHNARRDI